MTKKIVALAGDGIGPEIMEAGLSVLKAVAEKTNFDYSVQAHPFGGAGIDAAGHPLPASTLEATKEADAILLAAIGSPQYDQAPIRPEQGLLALRKELNLYANIRPVRSNAAVHTPFHDVDIVIFRENTEGLYVGQEEQIDENTVHAVKIVTRKASERIIRDAFEYAALHGRKKVTCVHKANILKKSDGMFLSIFREIAGEYPQIEADDKIIDNTCMQLVMNPNQFDVMVMQNLYGDILSDLCSGLIGGLGLVPSSNIGSDYAMFEAVHGSAPDIAGKHLANPTAFLWSACMMLEYLGENETASRIRKAVDEVLAEGKHLTRDLHGEASTEEYVDAVIARL